MGSNFDTIWMEQCNKQVRRQNARVTDVNWDAPSAPDGALALLQPVLVKSCNKHMVQCDQTKFQ